LVDAELEGAAALTARLFAKDYPAVNTEPVTNDEEDSLLWHATDALDRAELWTEFGRVEHEASGAASMVLVMSSRDRYDNSARVLLVGANEETPGVVPGGDEVWNLPTLGTAKTPADEAQILLDDVVGTAALAFSDATMVDLEEPTVAHLLQHAWVLRLSAVDGTSSHSFVIWQPPARVAQLLMEEIESCPMQLFEISQNSFDPEYPLHEDGDFCLMGEFHASTEAFWTCRGGTAVLKYVASLTGRPQGYWCIRERERKSTTPGVEEGASGYSQSKKPANPLNDWLREGTAARQMSGAKAAHPESLRSNKAEAIAKFAKSKGLNLPTVDASPRHTLGPSAIRVPANVDPKASVAPTPSKAERAEALFCSWPMVATGLAHNRA
jgi:hypothetical protein